MIGDPVAHSLSPAMHNAAIAALGVDAVFVALRATPETFDTVARGLLAAAGAASVTVPFKRAAAALLEVPTELVRRTGACNAVWTENGRVVGDHTDVAGVREAVRALLGGAAAQSALVLGTGGSARAAAVAIGEECPGVRLEVASRDRSRAADFVAWAASTALPCGSGGDAAPHATDLVVNATPLGLGADDPLPIALEALERRAPRAVLDLVYAPGETALVRAARALGIPAADGRGVLVVQGAEAFRRFFALEPPVEIMRAAVEDALRG